jgi:N-acetylmuramoyl-L-alanine amidase
MAEKKKRIIAAVLMGICTWCLSLPVAAESARELYFQAEACSIKLRDSQKRQKYRANWMSCIEKSQQVYRTDPQGPWAAAGLFMSGSLYRDLYKRSGNPDDNREAIDHFERILKRFPESGYAARARRASRAASQELAVKTAAKKPGKDSPTTGGRAAVRDQYYRAEACYRKLLDNPKLQKYRDRWLPCIKKFEAAYRTDPSDPWASASLYMAGFLYFELYKRSYNQTDRQNAVKHFTHVVRQYPDSAYRAKSQRAIEAIKRDDDLLAVIEESESSDGKSAVAEQPPADEPSAKAGEDPPWPSAGLLTVTGMRFWSNPNYTRLVIDLDGETTFAFNELRRDPTNKKPRRLYVDLDNARLEENLPRIIPIDDDLLLHARAGQYTPTSVRIVADMKSIQSYKVFSLRDPFRIVLDIRGGDEQEPSTSVARNDPQAGRIDPKKSTKDLARQLSLGVRRIVVDPGHGGKDYGAPGYLKGVHEKNVTLQIGRKLAATLRKELGCEVILTRNSDRFLTLEERTAFANTKNADLFISIHTNANRDPRAYGVSTYILNLASDDEARMVAAMENKTSTNNISDLETILFSLMHNTKIHESTRLAAYVQDATTKRLKQRGYSRVKSIGVKQAPFYVLLGAQMPAILVETSFISNPRECRRLVNPTYQQRLAEGIVRGVEKYIRETSPTALQDRRPQKGTQG